MDYVGLVKRVSVRETLMQLEVGASVVLKNSQVRYTTIYPSVKRLEKSTGRKFTVTIKGVPDGTRVTRNA